MLDHIPAPLTGSVTQFFEAKGFLPVTWDSYVIAVPLRAACKIPPDGAAQELIPVTGTQ